MTLTRLTPTRLTLARLLSVIWAALWLPTLGLIGINLVLTEPVMAEGQRPRPFVTRGTQKHRTEKFRLEKNRTEEHRAEEHRTGSQNTKQTAAWLYPLNERVFPERESFGRERLSFQDISRQDIPIYAISTNSFRLSQPSVNGVSRSQAEPPRPRPDGVLQNGASPIRNDQGNASQRNSQGAGQGANPIANQRGNRISHRLPIAPLASTLEVRAQSESFQTLEIFDTEVEKESFTVSLRRPFNRTRQSEFFLSLGFAYRNESLLAPPISAGSLPPFPLPPSPLVASPPAPLNSLPNRPPAPPSSAPRPVGGPPTGPTAGPPTDRTASPAAASGQNTPFTAPTPSSALLETSTPSPAVPPSSAPLNTSPEMSTGVLEFTQGYRQRDRYGQWLARSQFNLGTELADSPAPMNADAQFFSWLGRLERTQSIGNDHQLTLQLESQLSPNGLLPPYQFKMKDRRFDAFERGARPADISANNGLRLRLEDRMVLLRNQKTSTPIIALTPFIDVGYAWGQSNPQRPNQQFLGRTGLGFSVSPLSGFDIQVDYLTHWGDLRADDDAQNVYVTLGYQTDW